ncbi:MAG: NUDIX domain-containing protein [Spirochaetaceae bacterium]|nr:NUDIX domain-containing protein [Spirochaetaceae bacterium]
MYFHNTAAAAGCVIITEGRVLFLVRAKEPAAGKLDFPGGFIEPGEGALEGLRRECREELGWEPQGEFSFLASFPNVYPYKGIVYNTCDLFFTVSVPGLSEKDLRLDPEEITEARFIKPEDLDLREIAFDSGRKALRAWKEKNKAGF